MGRKANVRKESASAHDKASPGHGRGHGDVARTAAGMIRPVALLAASWPRERARAGDGADEERSGVGGELIARRGAPTRHRPDPAFGRRPAVWIVGYLCLWSPKRPPFFSPLATASTSPSQRHPSFPWFFLQDLTTVRVFAYNSCVTCVNVWALGRLIVHAGSVFALRERCKIDGFSESGS